MVSQLSVVKGAGELGGVRDYGGNGSIQQSISNEGKNWSKSSRWKSCSAWGGLSTLPVSRVAVLLVPLCQTVPQLGNGCYHTMTVTMILKYLHLLHFLHSVFFFSRSADTPPFHFLYIFYASPWADLEEPEE